MPALSQTRAYAALLVIVALWGSYPATAKLALVDFPPFFLAAVRCSIASAFLVLRLLRSGEDATRGLTPAAARIFLVLGLAGIWGSTQWTYVGYYYTTAGNAVILQAAAPVMVALTARAYLGERLRRRQWLGVTVSALGVLLVVTGGRLAALRIEELRAGDFLTLAALTGWAVYTVYGKHALGSLSPALATTGAYVAGTLLIYPTALATAPLYPAPRLASLAGWLVVVYQGVLGAVAHIWWYRAVEVVGPSRSAIFMNFQPIVGIALAAALLGEGVGLWQVLGTALVLAGVALTTGGK
ncbi:MAG: DMT family transporter [Candidatus Rokubacteria bacterium]|nr:DMT family transporter [Candidatus Rokubacteria bacterium]MBI2156680.1 DMT family transporter [Candidatus Rokubacteria bacterium]MBI4253517.1 DMT family transporter [Candidatus Rokubacteria bacterium]